MKEKYFVHLYRGRANFTLGSEPLSASSGSEPIWANLILYVHLKQVFGLKLIGLAPKLHGSSLDTEIQQTGLKT